MPRCIDCKLFPWKPDADFSMLPPIQCTEELQPRKWTKQSASMENKCLYFVGEKVAEQAPAEEVKVVDDSGADTRVKKETTEVTRRKNSGKRKSE